METPLLNGIRKQARFNKALGVLGGLGALSSIAYSTTWLKDRHDRMAREKRFDDMIQALHEIRGFYPKADVSVASTDRGMELIPTPQAEVLT